MVHLIAISAKFDISQTCSWSTDSSSRSSHVATTAFFIHLGLLKTRHYTTGIFELKINNCLILFFPFKVFSFEIFKSSSFTWLVENSSIFSSDHDNVFILKIIVINITFNSRRFQNDVLFLLIFINLVICRYSSYEISELIKSSRDKVLRSFTSSMTVFFGLYSFYNDLMIFFSFHYL